MPLSGLKGESQNVNKSLFLVFILNLLNLNQNVWIWIKSSDSDPMWAESIYKLPSIAESFGKNLPAVSLLFTFHCSFHWMCILLLHFCIFLLLYFGIFIFFAKPWSCPFLLSFHCMHFVFVFFAFSCSIVFDKVFMAKSSCCYQSGRGKALRYIGRFELKFAALSLIQSYLNHSYNGKKHPQKLWNWVDTKNVHSLATFFDVD